MAPVFVAVSMSRDMIFLNWRGPRAAPNFEFEPKSPKPEKLSLWPSLASECWECSLSISISSVFHLPSSISVSVSFSLASSDGSHTHRFRAEKSPAFHVPKRHFHLRTPLRRVSIRSTLLSLLSVFFNHLDLYWRSIDFSLIHRESLHFVYPCNSFLFDNFLS